MGKKLTPYVIVLIVLFSISIFFNLINLVLSLTLGNFFMQLNEMSSAYMLTSTIITVVTLVLAIIYLVNLINVRKHLFVLTHVVFGYYILITIVNTLLSISLQPSNNLMLGFAITVAVIGIGAALAVWITFYKHLVNAKQTKKLVFT